MLSLLLGPRHQTLVNLISLARHNIRTCRENGVVGFCRPRFAPKAQRDARPRWNGASACFRQSQWQARATAGLLEKAEKAAGTPLLCLFGEGAAEAAPQSCHEMKQGCP